MVDIIIPALFVKVVVIILFSLFLGGIGTLFLWLGIKHQEKADIPAICGAISMYSILVWFILGILGYRFVIQ